MIAKPNPYRRCFRNVYIRRLFGIIIAPLIIVFVIIPVIAFQAVAKELPRLIKELLNSIKDGNSYGRF
jgi:predicted PurR-regulated permease PerM